LSISEQLRAGDVGPYGELTGRPNPDGLKVVTVPAFENMLPFLEQQAGRVLTSKEVEEARLRAPSIALTMEDGANLLAGRGIEGGVLSLLVFVERSK
jgi:hypothetical protein